MNKYQKILVAICILVIFVPPVFFATKGFHHVVPASELQRAKQDWNNGQIISGSVGFLKAYYLATEGGIRWTVADVYIGQMSSHLDKGELEEALDDCARTAKVLSDFDDEGSMSNECFVIYERINRERGDKE